MAINKQTAADVGGLMRWDKCQDYAEAITTLRLPAIWDPEED